MKNCSAILCLFIFFCVNSYAQQGPQAKKRVSYFQSLKVKKLTQKLTAHLDTDEEKVAAIHYWITHNIKYDVKKFLSFDYEHVPVTKILRSRKAVCVGYCDLFNEMCKYADIRSVGVSGYTKNINVDYGDSIFLDEHIWNAVFIDNNWKLVDATWNSGYIKYFKRTLRGRLIYFFTRGKQDQLIYKPHFVRYPNTIYYCKSGDCFKTDHLPLNPLWQLTKPVSASEFVADSTYYLKAYNFGIDSVDFKDNLDYARQGYWNLSE
jgi:transglutaminase/protease-like cytokinesis protein 3